MSWSRPELVALVLMLSWALATASGSGASGGGTIAGAAEAQLDLKLSTLRVHRQLLQAEIARLYLDTFSPETPLLLEELQQRQQEVQLQIEELEGSMARDQDAHNLALHLAADFEYLQQKLDDLKQQLQQLDAMQTNHSSSNSNKHPSEAQRDAVNTTPSAPTSTIGSFFWTPLLTMPEFPSGSISQSTPSSPSLIKRLLAMLRPNASNNSSAASPSSSSNLLRGQRPEKDTKVQLLSPEQLLPQLQLQRQFLDDAIKRLEHLASSNNGDNKV